LAVWSQTAIVISSRPLYALASWLSTTRRYRRGWIAMFFKKCVDRVKRIEILGDQVLFRQPRPDLLFHGGEDAQED
jgi:hypothetical protein